MVNIGRRRIVLTDIGYDTKDNLWFWEPLGGEKGIKLEEHEEHTHVVRSLDTVLMHPNDPAPKRAASI